MRLVAMGLLPLVLAGCGAKYKPTGPVLGEYERALENPVQKRHDMLYSGRAPATQAPVLPVLAFGAAFDLDVALMVKPDEAFDMLELARMNVPWGDGYVWLALETDPDSGNQTLVADLDQLTTLMPEVPLARKITKMTVADRNTASSVDFDLSYEGTQGMVEATIAGDAPLKTQRKRNGNTFTHSQNQLMAVLDIPSSENLFKADVTVDGKNLPIKKIGGIVPGQFALNQAQGGFATGNYRIVPAEMAVGDAKLGMVVYHPPGSNEPPVAKTPADLRAKVTLATGLSQVKACWETRNAEFKVVEGQPGLQGGDLAYSWTVTNGLTSNVQSKPIEGSAFADEMLSKCVSDAIAMWRFDDDVTANMSWQFAFTPADPAAGSDAVTSGDAAKVTYEPFTAPTPDVVRPDPAMPGSPAPTPDGANPGDETLPDGGDLPDAGGPITVTRPEPEVLPLELSSFTSVHTMPDGSTVELPWLVSRSGDRVTATQTSDLRTLSYNFRVVSGTYLELYSITVEQYGRATPVTSVSFSPPLPDFRWSFQGQQKSNFVVDVNGQRSSAIGEVTSSWTDTGPKLLVNPTEPDWVAARPLVTQVIYLPDGTTEVRTQRISD